jgi:hypothetical protein
MMGNRDDILGSHRDALSTWFNFGDFFSIRSSYSKRFWFVDAHRLGILAVL